MVKRTLVYSQDFLEDEVALSELMDPVLGIVVSLKSLLLCGISDV